MMNSIEESRSDAGDDASSESTTFDAPDGRFDVLAEIVLSHGRFPLVPTITETSVDLRVGRSSLSDVVVVEAVNEDADSLDAFEDSLSRDPTVGTARHVAGNGGRRTYAVAVDTAFAADLFDALLSSTIHLLEVRSESRGWFVSFEATSRAEVRALTERLPKTTTVEIRRLGARSTDKTDDSSALTVRQRTVLRTALERGYFAVPRGCSQTDLAAEFDVSPAAVSQQVRRAVQRLVESTDVADSAP